MLVVLIGSIRAVILYYSSWLLQDLVMRSYRQSHCPLRWGKIHSFERSFFMPHTSDNDKKAKDNNALHHEKNMIREKNRERGANQYSKKTDHK
jgi:hypothetical protein